MTSRPQALRRGGRYAGSHAAGSWAALGTGDDHAVYPVDELYTKDDQFYGLPSFGVGRYVVSHLWRYRCDAHPTCFAGGFVSSELAFSYDSRNWTGFGQATSDEPVGAAAPSPPLTRACLVSACSEFIAAARSSAPRALLGLTVPR